ncbi:hypothetical protein K492DRAFT_237131 [Lichtheimia hyalospora FSU 10163]|nr:hypothetical protein K492DRAFT_237131 [Lichtheimia hyalospora FSU 10163]
MDTPNDYHALFMNKYSSTLPPRYSYDLQQRRRNSLQPPPSRQRPLSLSLTNRTDLNNRIADSFQEFSTMLQQFSAPQPKTPPPQKRTVNPLNRERWSVTSLPSVSSSTSTAMSSSSSALSLPVSPTATYMKTKAAEHEEQHGRYYQHESNELSVHPLSNAATMNNDGSNKRGSKIVQRLVRAACQGDLATVNTIINKEHAIQVDDELNEHGWTCLMYAACFGQIPIARILLDDLGASIDIQDKKGWTALVWATTRRHNQDMIHFLLERGASCSIRSLTGYPIYRLADVEMAPLLPHDAHIKRPKQPQRRQTEQANIKNQHNISYYTADMYDDDDDSRSMTTPEVDIDTWKITLQSLYRFDWDKCRPDQMFVFCEDDMTHIIDTIISDIKLPLQSHEDLWIPANVIYLCCRFSHNHSMKELTQKFLQLTITRFGKVVKANSRNLHSLAFWMTNFYQLLVYMRRDTKLAVSTMEEQQQIHALVTDIFDNHLRSYCERLLEKSIESTMLDHEEACGLEPVEYVDDSSWQRRMSFRRRSSSIAPPSTIITSITSLLDTLTSYRIHSDIQHQLIAHCISYIVNEVFDRMINNKKHLSRSKAIQVRMNVSTLEEWARTYQLAHLFRRITQLLQFLQCVSQLHELQVFQDTVRQFDLLAPYEIRHIVLNYRYEIGEPKLPATMPRLSEDLYNTRGENNQDETRIPFTLPPIDIMSKRRHDDFPYIPAHWVTKLDSK